MWTYIFSAVYILATPEIDQDNAGISGSEGRTQAHHHLQQQISRALRVPSRFRVALQIGLFGFGMHFFSRSKTGPNDRRLLCISLVCVLRDPLVQLGRLEIGNNPRRMPPKPYRVIHEKTSPVESNGH